MATGIHLDAVGDVVIYLLPENVFWFYVFDTAKFRYWISKQQIQIGSDEENGFHINLMCELINIL